MIVEMTQDMDLVREIVTTPEIWDRSTEDGLDSETYYPTFSDQSCWLLCKTKDEIAGIILLHHDNSSTLVCHPYLFKRFHSLGREMMNEFYKWVLEYLPESVLKISVTVPECHKKVYNFAKKVGFTEEGFSKSSFMKGGEVYGRWFLGITRQEMEAICHKHYYQS